MTSRDPLRSSTSFENDAQMKQQSRRSASSKLRGGGGGLSGTAQMNMVERKIKDELNKWPAVLTVHQLKNLDEHKYASSGDTLLDPYMQPYWRWLVLQMPEWLAPNLITLLGLIINVVTSGLCVLFSPNADQDVPAWCMLLCALGLFTYQSLDAIDGKQARRTNSSTPLGELFDHGCDSLSTVFVMVSLSVALKLGLNYPWCMFLVCFTAMTAFYTAHWQTYVTGALRFGRMDVTEAQMAVIGVYVLTGLFGDSVWSLTIPIIDLELRILPALAGLFGSISSIVSNLNIISQGGKGKNGSSIAGTSIVFPLFPLILFLFLSFSIANKSTIVYLSNLCLYTIAFGIVWAKITIKLIIAHMTKGEIYLLDSCLIGPVTLLLNQYFSYIIPELIVLAVALIIATFDLMKYSSKVCFQICTHMNIYLFKIAPPVSSSTSSSEPKRDNNTAKVN